MNASSIIGSIREIQKDAAASAVREEAVELGPEAVKLFRILKQAGEHATKGRDVGRPMFEAKQGAGGVTLRMLVEGRNAMDVAHQVARRFRGNGELKFADVVKTKKGAKVVLRPMEGSNEDA